MEYFVRFLDKGGNKYGWSTFYVLESGTFFDKLEETLYVVQELTPVHNNWKRDLRENGRCLFTYHIVEYAVVEWNQDERSITVQDI